MLSVKLAAQVLVAASGWFAGDPGVPSPLTPRVQQRVDELRRQVEELKREQEEQDRRLNQLIRQIHRDRLIIAEDQLVEVRKCLQSLEIVGPPTKIDAKFIDYYKSWQADLEREIRQHREALLKLYPPSPLESK